MDELMKLLESAMIPQEARQVLEAELKTIIEESEQVYKVKYDEQLDEARKELNELIPDMIEEAVALELEGVAEELAEARALDVTYAERLETFKEQYAQKTDEMIETLVAESVAEEMTELKEDIEVAKKHQFGVQIAEAFGDAYKQMMGDTDVNVHEELSTVKAQLESYQRKEKLDSILESVSGSKRKVAETVLEGVATDKLEERFESIKGFLLQESADEAAEGDETLTESADEAGQSEEPKGTVVLENVEEESETVTESAQQLKAKSIIQRSLARAKTR